MTTFYDYVFTALLYRVLGTNLKFCNFYKSSSYVYYRCKWVPSSNIHKAFYNSVGALPSNDCNLVSIGDRTSRNLVKTH